MAVFLNLIPRLPPVSSQMWTQIADLTRHAGIICTPWDHSGYIAQLQDRGISEPHLEVMGTILNQGEVSDSHFQGLVVALETLSPAPGHEPYDSYVSVDRPAAQSLEEALARSGVHHIPTMITLDYRAAAWAEKRIVLDTAQNHLPSDSGGSKLMVRLKQEGGWVDLADADRTLPTEEVRIEDDGVGYDAGLLSILFSGKADDPLSVGQFGEGLKLVAAATIRTGIEMEYRSRNWTAIPYSSTETVGGYPIKRLNFKVIVNGEDVQGAQTTFTDPPEQLLTEIFALPDNVLALNNRYEELYVERDLSESPRQGVPILALDTLESMQSTVDLARKFAVLSEEMGVRELESEGIRKPVNEGRQREGFGEVATFNPLVSMPSQGFGIRSQRSSLPSYLSPIGQPYRELSESPKPPQYSSRIIDLHPGETTGPTQLFVKGIRVKEIDAIFSYDLGIDKITPDRHFAAETEVKNKISALLRSCDNKAVIKRVLEVAEQEPHGKYKEFDALTERRDYGGFGIHLPDSIKLMQGLAQWGVGRYDDESIWKQTFHELFGSNAVLSSRKMDDDKDAEAMGHVPIKLNYSIAELLKKKGVQTASDLLGKSEYRFVDADELTAEERAMLSLVDRIQEEAIGRTIPIELRVYSGVFLESGREIESAMAAHITLKDGRKLIGIKREALQSLEEFVEKYLHEFGHDVAQVGDYERKFTDFFVRGWAKEIARKLGKSKKT